jgi:hypothetical protein
MLKTINLRKDGIRLFGDQLKKDGLGSTILDRLERIDNWPKKAFDNFLVLSEVKSYADELLPKNEMTNKRMINDSLYNQLAERVGRNILYSFCNRLTDQGIFEMFFDVEANDFRWRVSKKFRESKEKENDK